MIEPLFLNYEFATYSLLDTWICSWYYTSITKTVCREGCGRTVVTSLSALSHHLATGTEESHEELRLARLWVENLFIRIFLRMTRS